VSIVIVILLRIFTPWIEPLGWTSLMIAVMFFGGIQLIFIGILGEYICRIFDEVKNRPMYLVKEKVGF
jgi:dolichol-phosphate mannosyltransferase